MLFSSNIIFSQNIGINTSEPTETLDINGTVRIRAIDIKNSNESYDILVKDNNGVIKKVSKKDLEIKKETITIKLEVGETATITNTLQYNVANIIVTAGNSCGRTMIANFQTNLSALVYINAIARDKIGEIEIIPIPSSASGDTSVGYKVKFPGVTACADGGNSTAFNFTFEKKGKYTYNITNNGNIAKSYTIILQKIS